MTGLIYPGMWFCVVSTFLAARRLSLSQECTTCQRLRRIMREAPWSSYDLLAGLIALSAGIFLIASPDLFDHIGGVYQPMANVASERYWGIVFVACGLFGIAVTIAGRMPPFLAILAGRMATAFCLLSLAGNNLLNVPPPLSAVTYVALSIWSVWGILRTRPRVG